MTVDEIKEILELMREHELAEFELQRDGETLRLRKHADASGWRRMPALVPAAALQRAGACRPGGGAGTRPPATPPSSSRRARTWIWRSSSRRSSARSTARPNPARSRSSNVGETVRKGQVLCIIEAMKLMNEINAECDGEIVKVYVENGQAVQYGERLFAIKHRA